MQLLRNNTERERGKICREASVPHTLLPPVVTSDKTRVKTRMLTVDNSPIFPSWTTRLWWRGWRNSMQLWAMLGRMGHSEEFWWNVVHWRRERTPLQYSCLKDTMDSMKGKVTHTHWCICLYIISSHESMDSPPQSKYKMAPSPQGCLLLCFYNITQVPPTLHPQA